MSVEDYLDGLPARRRAVAQVVGKAGAVGATWGEVADALGLHHGSASGALSSLHKTGMLVRLKEKRGRSSIYVIPQYAWTGETVPYRPNPRAKGDSYEAGRMKGFAQGREHMRQAVLVTVGQMTQTTPASVVRVHDNQCWRIHPRCALKVVAIHVQQA